MSIREHLWGRDPARLRKEVCCSGFKVDTGTELWYSRSDGI